MSYGNPSEMLSPQIRIPFFSLADLYDKKFYSIIIILFLISLIEYVKKIFLLYKHLQNMLSFASWPVNHKIFKV